MTTHSYICFLAMCNIEEKHETNSSIRKASLPTQSGSHSKSNDGVLRMSQHNQLNWTDFLLCIGMELAYFKNGERPIQEQMIAEKLIEIGGLK